LYHLIVTYLFKSYHISKGDTLLGDTSPVSVPSQLLYVWIYIIFFKLINETPLFKKKGHLNFTDDPFCLLIGKDYLFKIDQVESQSFDPNAPLKLTCSKNPSDGTVSTSSKAEPPDFGK
jgi:hypothetical protein